MKAMDEAAYDFSHYCPKYEEAMAVLGKRWTGLILRALFSGSSRFSAICAYVPGLSDRLLSERLKELESIGIIERLIFPETPVRIEYHLTLKGQELRPVLDAVQAWADTWIIVAETAQPV
jgi:DNA-binding HxlR family transcriptional regulator